MSKIGFQISSSGWLVMYSHSRGRCNASHPLIRLAPQCLLRLALVLLALVLSDLLAPAVPWLAAGVVHGVEGRQAYYRLGKKRWRSGILSRYSRFALSIQAMPTMPPRARPTTAVLAFQLAGWAYQPPAGDQTCLGYLRGAQCVRQSMAGVQAYGIFPPPPMVSVVRVDMRSRGVVAAVAVAVAQ